MQSLLFCETPPPASPSILVGVGTILGIIGGWFLKLLADYIQQKTAFDHRFRLEKEYRRYCDLWKKLFNLRRSVGQLTESIGSTGVVDHGEEVVERYNAFKNAVRFGEPFINPAIYEASREICSLALNTINNLSTMKDLKEHNDKDRFTKELEELDDKNDKNVELIEKRYEEISQAIRRRVTP